jgi:hypothetical protein
MEMADPYNAMKCYDAIGKLDSNHPSLEVQEDIVASIEQACPMWFTPYVTPVSEAGGAYDDDDDDDD